MASMLAALTESMLAPNLKACFHMAAMQKENAVNFFGGVGETAVAIGISPQAVRDWPSELPARIADRVIAAVVRSGRAVPPEFLKARAPEVVSTP